MSLLEHENTGALPEVLEGLDLTDQQTFARGVPYELFARLRAEAPVLLHPPGHTADGESFWVATRHADIARVASDPVFSSQGGGGRAGGGSHLDDLPADSLVNALFFMMDNPRHDLVGQLLTPAVTGAAVTALEGPLREHLGHLLDEAVAPGPVNVVDVTEKFAVTAMARLLGAPREDWDTLLAWVRDCLGFIDRRTGLVDDRSTRTYQAMHEYFTELVGAKRRQRPAPDLGSVLAHGRIAEHPGQPPLSDVERAVNLTVLFVSGIEQPRNTIAGGVAAFAEHPQQWEALKGDRSLLPGAIEEVLRWTPANPYNRRTAVRDTELGGQPIRAGEKVTVWWPSANRDERVFTEPDSFDVRRSPNPHLSFGAGLHHCLGAELARMMIRVALEELLARVAAVRLEDEVMWAPNNKHTVLLDVPVELVPVL